MCQKHDQFWKLYRHMCLSIYLVAFIRKQELLWYRLAAVKMFASWNLIKGKRISYSYHIECFIQCRNTASWASTSICKRHRRFLHLLLYQISDIKELWIRNELHSCLHVLAAALGKQKCLALPILHALSGEDDTGFIYGLGKRKFNSLDIPL